MVPYKPTSVVVERGVYSRTRNPIYLGFALITGGAAAWGGGLWGLGLLGAALAVVRRGVVDREERYLTARFGPPYAAYQDRVPRWL